MMACICLCRPFPFCTLQNWEGEYIQYLPYLPACRPNPKSWKKRGKGNINTAIMWYLGRPPLVVDLYCRRFLQENSNDAACCSDELMAHDFADYYSNPYKFHQFLRNTQLNCQRICGFFK